MGINIQQIYSGISAQIKNFILKSLPGMNNKVVDLDLSTKWAQNAQNARFELTPGAVDKRDPVTFYNATAVTTSAITGLYRMYTSTGSDLWVSTSGTGAYVGNDVAGTFTQIRSSLTTGKRHQFVVYQNLLIASNGYDPMWVYDGDTVNNVTWQLGACKALPTTAAGSMGVGQYYYAMTTCASAGTSGVTTVDTWVSGALSNTITTTTAGSSALSNIPLGPPGTAARKLYRVKAGGTQLYYLDILNDNVTTTYSDVIADSSLSSDMPAVTDAMPKGALLTLERERLFISGDPSNPNYIYYSATYLPHYIQQTTQLTYMAIDNNDGDAITGIPIQLGVMVCIKRNSIRILHITSPVSGADPTTWYADDPLAWIGSPAPYSVTQTPSGVVFLGYDHWYIFDGASAQPIIDEFDTSNILQAAYNDTIAYYNNGILLAAYTDITSAAAAHNRIMRWNFRRQALGIDTWTSTSLTGANCFAGRTGDSEAGDLFYGDSLAGYVVKDQNSENVYSLITQTDANAGTLTNIFVGGSENSPTITIGAANAPNPIPNGVCVFWSDPTTNPGVGWTEITGFNGCCLEVTTANVPMTSSPGVAHQHTLYGSIPLWTGTTGNSGNTQTAAIGAHTHAVEYLSDPSTPLPRCVFLRLFQKNSNTVETEFPINSIVMYDQASTPDGWQSLNSVGFTGYYIALNQAGTEYAFSVSGISVWPVVGSTYSDNGNVYTITFAPLSGSEGIIYATVNQGGGDPEVTGYLVNVSGTGDAQIAFSAWTSQSVTLNSVNPSVHSHTFYIPTGTAAGAGAVCGNPNPGVCPYIYHDHIVAGTVASINMDTQGSTPWEVQNLAINFIQRIGEETSWDGVNRYAYCLYASTGTPAVGWTNVTTAFEGNFVKVGSSSPTTSGPSGASHIHTPGTYITSFESDTVGDGGYEATCYQAPHDHTVTLSTTEANAGNPPSVSFNLVKTILGQMLPWNNAITTQYTNGLYVSAAQQINAQSLDKLYWNQSIIGPNDTIAFYVRTGATEAACTSATWSGPYTNPNGSDISGVAALAWFQYEIVFYAPNTTVTNPQVYFTDGYAVQYTYYIGAQTAETSVNFVYGIGFRNLDMPSNDKIFKKVSTTHIASAGSFTLTWATENATDTLTVNTTTNPGYWDSYFQSTAMGKQIDLTVSQNDNNPLKLKQMQLFYSEMQTVV